MRRLVRRRGVEMPVTVTYLEMQARPALPSPPPPMLKTAILRCEKPAVHFYRYLYNTIGEPYFWVERRQWNNEKLSLWLGNDKLLLYVLYLGGAPGGMAELDFRVEGQCQIAYFGLMPQFVGRKIGPWFLHQAVEIAWGEPIGRLLVNTCTLDHKKALATYQRAGFTPYSRAERVVRVPPEFPRA
jgi:GNAT superfamily N-acetyltransferase